MLAPIVDVTRLEARITRLRGEAFALCSEIRDLELQLPWPPEHQCIDCEVGWRLTHADSLSYDHPWEEPGNP